jgi:choline dehydrogenase-like flavoprotein
MALFDAIVVGSGPAGTFAAYALRGRNILMLDVGFTPPDSSSLDDNIFKLRLEREDLFLPLIGENFESLHNVHNTKISLKLKSPYMSFIVRDWKKLSPISSQDFEGVCSFARGGLANAWGAGVYRFNDDDLRGFPVTAAELDPYYKKITAHIGVSGRNDDLEPYFGHDEGLMEPMRLSGFASGFLKGYENNRGYFNRRGIFVGAPRLAVLTKDHNRSREYGYENLEFFKPFISAVYNPAYTLDEMVKERSLRYEDRYLVEAFREQEGHVEVFAKNLKTGEFETFRAGKLILAAGALSTAKIVLRSNNDYDSKLPFLDNPMAVMLLFRIDGIGAKLEMEGSSLTQLNIVYDGPASDDTLQASLYGTSGPLRSDVLFDLPLPLSANMNLMRNIAQACGAVMLFYPGRQSGESYIRLRRDGAIEVHCVNEKFKAVENEFIRTFRKIGYYGSSFMSQHPKMGTGLHYAGMLPMKDTPGRYHTDRIGRLFGTKNVFIVDGACFSTLPSKNLTFTIMANSMRIADSIRSELPAS